MFLRRPSAPDPSIGRERHVTELDGLSERVVSLFRAGELERALDAAHSAERFARLHFGRTDPLVARALSNVAFISNAIGDAEGAERDFLEVLAIRRASPDDGTSRGAARLEGTTARRLRT